MDARPFFQPENDHTQGRSLAKRGRKVKARLSGKTAWGVSQFIAGRHCWRSAGFPTCGIADFQSAGPGTAWQARNSRRLRIGNPRPGRLEVCATASPRGPLQENEMRPTAWGVGWNGEPVHPISQVVGQATCLSCGLWTGWQRWQRSPPQSRKLFAQQLRHQRPLFLEFVLGDGDFAAAEFIERHALNDLP